MPIIFNSSVLNPGSIQANVLPEQAYNFAVEFSTFDNVLSEDFVEAHVANAINITPQNTSSSKKFVIPLTNQSTNGSPFIKLHLPQPDSSKMFITFCIKHNGMSDGYYDYISGIPSAYRTALNAWIQNLPVGTVGSVGATYYRTLQFNVYGFETNQAQSAKFFEVRFRYSISNIINPGGGGIGIPSSGGGIGSGNAIPAGGGNFQAG